MLRNGQFDNLQWDKVPEAHSANWTLLQTKYGLSPQQTASAIPLSKLAAESIKACREYLFTDTNCKEGWQTGRLVGIISKDELEECMSPALCDHLIVTFAYRFFCDNLIPRTLSECLDAIYNCLDDSLRIGYKYTRKKKDTETDQVKVEPVEDKDKSRSLKSNFIKPKKRSCEAYYNNINAVFSFYKQQLQYLHDNLSEDYCAGLKRRKWLVTNRRLRIARRTRKNNISRKRRALEHRKLRLSDHAFLVIPRTIDLTPEVKSDIALVERELEARTAEQYAAPNWLYTIAMACSWTTSPLAAKKERLVFERDYCGKANLLYNLTRFLGSSEWELLLFGKAVQKSKRFAHPSFIPVAESKEICEEIKNWQLQASPSLLELRLGPGDRKWVFVGVPYIQERIYQNSLPPQSYTVKGSTTPYEIPCEIQQMLNSYLVERTFHGFASALAMECIKRRQVSGSFHLHRDQYQMLPAVVRLRAPLLHSAWIQFADYLVGETAPSATAIPWIEDQVDCWNRFALPILEEHFIQNVWSHYRADNIDTVLSEITKALEGDGGTGKRCDRLNLYQLVPVAEHTQSPKADDVVNEVMKNAYLAGLGCKLGQTDGRWIDPGRATAFEVV